MTGFASTYLAAVKQKLIERYQPEEGTKLVDTVDYLFPVDEDKRLDTPALLIEVESLDEGIDAGDETAPFVVRVALHCVLSHETENYQIEIINFAADVAKYVRNQRWGLTGVGKPVAINSAPALFNPGREGDVAWTVSFEQSRDYGDSAWAPDPDLDVPGEVFVGHSPKVGIDHVNDYTKVFPVNPQEEGEEEEE